MTEEDNTCLITNVKVEMFDSSNHHEADTRLILQATKSIDPVIVRSTDTDILILLTFAYSVRTCMYPGNEHEEFVTTRIRMYNKQKVKSSSSILPDESSINEHLKRSDLQAFVGHQCLKQNIEYPSIKHRGWEKMEDGIQPIWFICHQFPPSLSLLSSRTRLTPVGQ